MGQWLADFMVSNCGIPKDKIHVVGAGINVPIAAPDYSKKAEIKYCLLGKILNVKVESLLLKHLKY